MLAEKRIENGFYIIDGGKATLTARQIENRARKILDIDAEIKRLQADRDAIKAEIVASMNGDAFETSRYAVKNTLYKASRFDSKAFKADYPGMYQEYCKTSETRRFTVSAK